eukprot:UN03792
MFGTYYYITERLVVPGALPVSCDNNDTCFFLTITIVILLEIPVYLVIQEPIARIVGTVASIVFYVHLVGYKREILVLIYISLNVALKLVLIDCMTLVYLNVNKDVTTMMNVTVSRMLQWVVIRIIRIKLYVRYIVRMIQLMVGLGEIVKYFVIVS